MKGPVLAAGEMAMPSAEAVVATLNSTPGYVTASIITFLKSTAAEPAAEYLKTPALPKSGPKTPAPDPS